MFQLGVFNCKEFADHPFRVTHRTNEFAVLTQPAKRNKFCNRTCVFIWSTYFPKALSKQATHRHTIFTPYSYHIHTIFTQDIHWITVFKNQGLHHGKHRRQPFQKFAQIFVGLQVKIIYLSLESFTLLKLSDVAEHTPMSIVICEKGCSGRCLFYFQCSTVNIYKHKGKYLLRRIPHASHRSFNSFVISNIINKNTSMGIHHLRYVAISCPLTQVSLQGQSILL